MRCFDLRVCVDGICFDLCVEHFVDVCWIVVLCCVVVLCGGCGVLYCGVLFVC